jgi:dipeptidyl aminopeptidase/acylaminoacyl peptidase
MTSLRRAAVVAVILVLAAACGDDDSAPPATRRGDEEPPPPEVRSDTREIAGLLSLVVRPVPPGPYPLVVFVHGAGAPPVDYTDLLEDIASAGHVVVAPAMPGSVDDSSIGALLALPFQPGRVRQVIAAVTGPGPEHLRAVDPQQVALVGHSLGGMTALAVGYHTCCVDPRVDAVVSIAGEAADFPNGQYQAVGPPLLLVHGERDDTVPYEGSVNALALLGNPAYLLTLEDADHGSYLGPEARRYRTVVDAIDAFLDATVGGAPAAGLADLRAAGNRPGVTLEAGPS